MPTLTIRLAVGRWEGELEPTIGRPCWGKVASFLHPYLDPHETRAFLAGHADAVEQLPETMRECAVEKRVIEGVARRCGEIAADLRDAGGKG